MPYARHKVRRPRGATKWAGVLVAGAVMAPLLVLGQVQSTYLNLGKVIYEGVGVSANTVPYPPQINATNFVNKGLMELVVYPYPFQTAYTLNFTNDGEMLGEIGWEFDYGTATGQSPGRGMAASFYNGTYNPNNDSGLIESYSGGLPNPSSSPFDYPLGYLWVSATNVVNKGYLLADAAAEIKLQATNMMDLSRSYVWIYPVSDLSIGTTASATNFTSDVAIYDLYWGVGTLSGADQLDSSALWSGTVATSDIYGYNAPCATIGNGELSFYPSAADSYSAELNFGIITYTNITGISPPYTNVAPTNIVIGFTFYPTNDVDQAVFVYSTDPNITATTGFIPSPIARNPYQTVCVELSDSATGDTLDLADTIASIPGTAYLPNTALYPAAQCSDVTARPANYLVARDSLLTIKAYPGALSGFPGTPGLGVPSPLFLSEPYWNNNFTNAIYSDYSWFVDNQDSEPPTAPGELLSPSSSVTNLVGRVRISTGNLNLLGTDMRAEGELMVNARHVISSQDDNIDCENLSYNLSSTNGLLNVQGFVPPAGVVYRFQGTNAVWSAFWTNVQIIITPSYIFSNVVYTNFFTNTSGVFTNSTETNFTAVYAPETNFTYIGLTATMLDASMLSSIVPVSVYDLALHSTNMVINDNMSVISTFLLDGPSFTLNGALTFPGVARTDPLSGTTFCSSPIVDWVYTMSPSLLYFTNNGSITIPDSANFGSDGPTNYLAFVNNGGIYAGNQDINAVNLQDNNGVHESFVSDFTATAGTASLSNAEIFAEGNINITAGTLAVDSSLLSAVSTLNFDVATNFSDAGPGSGNAFSCQNGFNLSAMPVNGGNLLGTTITTISYGYEAYHTWAGNDDGALPAGFTNNVALYSLVLSPQEFSSPVFTDFYFSGASQNNALYVGTLDLSQLGSISDITNLIGIDPTIRIYYAHMLLGFTPPGSQTPEEYMDGRFGGQLRWVKGYNGLSEAALSKPLSPKLAASYSKSQGQVSLTLSGIPDNEYIIQASTNLVNWTPILTNSTAVNGLLQFLDATSAKYHSRFYRAVPAP